MLLPPLQDLDLRLLKVFMVVIDRDGLTPAAAALNVSVSTVSAQIADLEHRLGFRLCDRGRRGFALTPEGQQVRQALERLFAQLGDFAGVMGGIRGELTGNLQIVVVHAVITQPDLRLPQAISAFRAMAPRVNLALSSRSVGETNAAVLAERADLGVNIAHDLDPDLKFTGIGRESVSLYCGAGHPLFDRVAGDITAEEVARLDQAHRPYMEIAAAGVRRRNRPSPAAIADDIDAMAILVLSGGLTGYLPDHHARPWVEQGLMRALLPGQLSYVNAIGHLVKRSRPLSAAAKAFLACWHKVLAEPCAADPAA
ncbi:MAG: LysR family transcriptional regulator [Zavarzinia sp.]|nr:LysR family transcriptional regulator [Zavarzinia sp.]